MTELYKGANPNQFNTGEDLSFAKENGGGSFPENREGTIGYTRGIEPESISYDDKSYEVKGNPFTPSERLSPIEMEENPPIVMSEDERIAKKRELDMSALTPPPQYELPKIPLGLNIFMLTMDAFTGKANWLNFLLNDRKRAEAGIAKKNSDSLNTFIKNQPIREQQIKAAKLAVDRQYYSGQRTLKGYGMQMGDREKTIRIEQMAIARSIDTANIELQAIEFEIANPKETSNVEGLKLKQATLKKYIREDTERLHAKRYAFIGAEMSNGDTTQRTDTEPDSASIDSELME